MGTEHVLMGLIREEKGIAAQVLASFGATRSTASSALDRLRDVTADGTPRAGRPVAAPEDARPVWFLEVDAAADAPIYEQIVARVEEAVATGRLDPGERHPQIHRARLMACTFGGRAGSGTPSS